MRPLDAADCFFFFNIPRLQFSVSPRQMAIRRYYLKSCYPLNKCSHLECTQYTDKTHSSRNGSHKITLLRENKKEV